MKKLITPSQPPAVQSYYDTWTDKLTRDFILGNHRQVEGIRFVLRSLYADCRSVLDLGCGIGWSSYEIARALPEAKVTGLDISPALIDRGRSTFTRSNLRLMTFPAERIPKGISYDAVVMLDFFEHIDPDVFIPVLSRLIAPTGQVFLACPTVLHQQHLRRHGIPMQPVDRDVTMAQVLHLAHDLGGQLTHFEYCDVFTPNDYFHALIDMAPLYGRPRLGRTSITPALRRMAMARRVPSWPDLKFMLKQILWKRRN